MRRSGPRVAVESLSSHCRVAVGSPVESPGRRGDGRPLSRRRWRGGRAPAPVSSARSCRTGFRGGSGRGRGYRAPRGSPWKTCAQGDRGRERVKELPRAAAGMWWAGRRVAVESPGVESRAGGGMAGLSRAGGGGAAGGRGRRSRSRRGGAYRALRGSPWKTCARCQSTKSRSGRNSFSCGGRSGRPRASTSWRKTSP